MEKLAFLFLCASLFSGISVDSLSYDYSASIECLAEPLSPQYGGGLITNPEFNNGLEGWSTFGHGKTTVRSSASGNRFSVAQSRDKPYQSISQKVYLQKEMLYTFSAWLQVAEGSAPITVTFKTSQGFVHAGAVEASSGCWSMLKGGLTVNASGPAEFYFESKNITQEIWVDSVSLKPFTRDQWRSHHTESINKVRKRRVRFQAVDATTGNILPNATVSIKLARRGFPFGLAITQTILNNMAYQRWFTSRQFTVTTFVNEMKWYSNEVSQGKENYWAADAMIAFAKQHGVAVRGHNVLWDDPHYQMDWVNSLSNQQLQAAASKRVNSVVSRYRNQVIAWDVVNENLHFNYFESKLGRDASVSFYRQAHLIDPRTLMFLNEYNTLEEPGDPTSTPTRYLQKLSQIKASGATMAIGLEGHFTQANIPYIRSALDTLAQAKVPIWLTEVDVSSGPNQVRFLEEVLREAFAHPAVNGIVIWAPPLYCSRMCLTDNNFRNLGTGDVVDRLMSQWKSDQVVGMADGDGFLEVELFHGEYEAMISHPLVNSSKMQSLIIDSESPHTFLLEV